MAKEAVKKSGATSEACCPKRAKLRPRATKGYVSLFKALGDETRLEMVALLAAAKGELCVCDIEVRFDLKQPTVSHHLRVLREAGLVRAQRRGTWVYYALEADVLDRVHEFRTLLSS